MKIDRYFDNVCCGISLLKTLFVQKIFLTIVLFLNLHFMQDHSFLGDLDCILTADKLHLYKVDFWRKLDIDLVITWRAVLLSSDNSIINS